MEKAELYKSKRVLFNPKPNWDVGWFVDDFSFLKNQS